MRCLVLGPSTATWSARTLLVIQGDGETWPSAAEEWRPLVDEGWTLLIPDVFCWSDMDGALEELSRHVEKARSQGVETDDLVVAGVREGAPLALSFAMERGLPWLCVFPRFPLDYAVSARATPGAPGALLLDEEDDSGALFRVFSRFHVIRVDGSGSDFASYASAALEKIVNGRESVDL